MPPPPPTVSLVIPTFNEAENIAPLLGEAARCLEAAGIAYEILVVDDDSPDGTGDRAEAAAAGDARVRVLRRRGERGLAAAVLRGWREARGEILAVMDADLQHPPEMLPELVRAVQGGACIAVASRFVPGGAVDRPTPLRAAASALATRLAARLSPGAAQVRDPLSGFFALRRQVVGGLTVPPRGYKILLEVLARGRYGRVQEVPFTLRRRQRGRSKLTARVCWESLRHLWRLARRR